MKHKIAMITVLVVIGIVGVAGAAFAMGGFAANPTQKKAVQDAIAAGDYNAWKSAMEASLTKERFDAIKKQYDSHKAVQDAISADNYDAYKAAVSSKVLSQADFEMLAQLEKARASGDTATVQKLENEFKASHPCFGRRARMHGFGMMHGALESPAPTTQ